MPHSYSVSGCTNRSDRETGLSYFKLPLKRKAVLKQWIHVIRRTNLPINTNTCVCSIHFLNATGHLLRPNEVPSLHLPQKSTGNKTATRKPLKERPSFEKLLRRKRTNQKVNDKTGSDEINVSVCSKCKSGQREGSSIENWNICFMKKSKRTPGCCRSLLVQKVCFMKKSKRIVGYRRNLPLQKANYFDWATLKTDFQVRYYTGFSSFFALKSFYDYLGPAVDHLRYSHDGPIADEQVKRCSSRALPPLEEFFMTMVRLHAGLFEQDIAY